MGLYTVRRVVAAQQNDRCGGKHHNSILETAEGTTSLSWKQQPGQPGHISEAYWRRGCTALVPCLCLTFIRASKLSDVSGKQNAEEEKMSLSPIKWQARVFVSVIGSGASASASAKKQSTPVPAGRLSAAHQCFLGWGFPNIRVECPALGCKLVYKRLSAKGNCVKNDF